ncbi:hypothetical protein [Actinoplanes lobatus]|uniref:Uncharacterized protein n=1 Tax=Actinoplanes lobatus TaxID=113568 RepID=A0A7W7HRE8_9ACTN|nr:hypothetical protein [Actinoplanes lobatus]MBB4755338.1 hypothetical protein [Actinoplanes lobatus]GIE46396.1 hypothetical protein Alo02nite_92940 [Actinoplanes lobatus]
MTVYKGEAARVPEVTHLAEHGAPTACGLPWSAIPFRDTVTTTGRNATCPACRSVLSTDVVSGFRS